jgi:transcriptional regulator with XRE-family HTH domain
MEKSDVKVAIREAIGRAARGQGWTIAELAGRLDVGVSTLHRWKASKSTTLDLAAMIQIFSYAGMSMDQAFGLAGNGAARQGSEAGVSVTDRKVSPCKRQMTRVRWHTTEEDAILVPAPCGCTVPVAARLMR